MATNHKEELSCKWGFTVPVAASNLLKPDNKEAAYPNKPNRITRATKISRDKQKRTMGKMQEHWERCEYGMRT